MRYLIFAVVFGVVLSSTAWTEESFYEPVPEMKHPADNKWSQEKEELGKMLYFDPRLSGSNWISCATCHNPGLGWGDGHPPILNLDYDKSHN